MRLVARTQHGAAFGRGNQVTVINKTLLCIRCSHADKQCVGRAVSCDVIGATASKQTIQNIKAVS